MCAIMTWGAHKYFMHPIFVLKNGCDMLSSISMSIGTQKMIDSYTLTNCKCVDALL
jgi:hypothetical protein